MLKIRSGVRDSGVSLTARWANDDAEGGDSDPAMEICRAIHGSCEFPVSLEMNRWCQRIQNSNVASAERLQSIVVPR